MTLESKLNKLNKAAGSRYTTARLREDAISSLLLAGEDQAEESIVLRMAHLAQSRQLPGDELFKVITRAERIKYGL